MLMTSGLNFGIRKTIPHLLGINLGFPLMVAAVGFGLGHIFLLYPILHTTIKFLGAGYLLFLAWKIANSASPKLSNEQKKPLTFFQAAIFQWLNPKAWVIAIGAIATFTTVGDYDYQLLVILSGYLTVGALSMLFWSLLGAFLQRLISNQKHIRYFNISMGIVLVVSVVPMLLTEFKSSI